MPDKRVTGFTEVVSEPTDNSVFLLETDAGTPLSRKIKYATLKSLLAGVSTVNTGGILWVDSQNGDNGTALPDRLDKPYLTLTAAKTAASSGDTIIVFPGTYDENDLAKNGVNWFFFPGAIVNYTGAGATAIFEIVTNSTVFKVSGYGEFENSGSGGGGVLKFGAASPIDIFFDAERIESSSGSAINVVSGSSGHNRITSRLILQSDFNAAIACNDIAGNALSLLVKAEYIYNSAGPAIKLGKSRLKVVCDSLFGTDAVVNNGDIFGLLVLQTERIGVGIGGVAINITGGVTGIIHLIDATIQTSTQGIRVDGSGGDLTVSFRNVVIYSLMGGSSLLAETGTTFRVRVLGGLQVDKPHFGDGTFIFESGAHNYEVLLTVDGAGDFPW